jgi:hypothetical protein
VNDVTVVIPSIPPRRRLLRRALQSVEAQTRPADAVIVEMDSTHAGAGPTRTAGLRKVETEWTAFLDDDDYWYPQHLQRLLETAEETGADLVYPWYDVKTPGDGRSKDPLACFEGKPWDPEHPHLFPISALVRTRFTEQAAFPPVPKPVIGPHGLPENPDFCGDDWPFWCQVFEAGPKVYHLNERTWVYWHHGFSRRGNPVGNTSGRGDRW